MKSFRILLIVTTLLPYLVTAQDGALDNTFGNGDGYKIMNLYPDQHAFGNHVAVYPDGSMLVSCGTNTSGFSEAVLLRLLPNGEYDHSFNGSGKLHLAYPNTGLSASASVILPDGKIVMVSGMSNYSMSDSIALFRFHPDGLPDNTFNDDGMAIANFGFDYQRPNTLQLQADGKLVIAGYVGNYLDTFDQFYIARFLPNGLPDPSFDQDGFAVTHYGNTWTNIRDLLIQPDGKYVVAGYYTQNEQEDMVVLRFNHNGTLDQTFNGDGIAALPFSPSLDDHASGLALQPDGKILVGGTASLASGNPGFGIARLTPDGNLDPDFHGDGMNIIQTSPIYEYNSDMLLQPDGKIILGGKSKPSNTERVQIALVRLLPNGIPDQTFDGDGIALTSFGEPEEEIHKMAFAPDGKVVIVGSSFYNYRSMIVARYLTGITVSNHADVEIVKEISVFPNPVVDQFSIHYSMLAPQNISMSISDAQGRMVQQLMPPTSMQAGRHEATFQLTSRIAPGLYFVNVTVGAQATAVGIVVQ